MSPLELVFTVSLVWLCYAYLGYPLLLVILAQLSRREKVEDASYEPTVTILIAAFNEADFIGETLANKLALEYPAEKVDIIVVSDESTDGTDEIVNDAAAAHPGRIRLIRQVPRRGKTSGLNLAVPEARGEILVFSDANSIYEPGALAHLVGTFADPAIGYVTGKMVYTNPDGSVTGDGCTAYMRYENQLRAGETRVGSVVGVDGGIDAVRRDLHVQMRADQLPDFVLPLRVVEQGYRVAYEPRAILRESALSSSAQEYRMRVRVTLRALWALLDLRQLMNPLRYPMFSWQLGSHKVLRYLAFIPQIAIFASNAWLAATGPLWAVLFAAQVLFYLLAGMGYLLSRAKKSFMPANLAWYFTLLNLACMHACARFLRGEKQVLWQPRTG
ncbi:MAG: glycosyltransferase family 2 protein [Gammaproteobacteria bacterium]|nr:MAG: glycosyltransferase family 2 protein [Gammaproteobacteria bacterium]